jgi:Zn-finger nucleic acid-binding protein
MRQYERGGVVVDQCGECRGIFLDRGELERLIDAETSWHGGPPQQRQPQYQQQQQQQQQYQQQPPRYRDHDSDEYPVYHPHKKKRRGFLEELFD